MNTIVAALVACAVAWGEPPVSAGTRPPIAVGETSLKRADASVEAVYHYRLVEPPAAAVAEGLRVPLVVFLHGAGERGDDNKAQLTHFVNTAAGEAFQAKAPCFILAMQCPRDESWAPIDIDGIRKRDETPRFSAEPTRAMRAVMQAMDDVLATRPIDRSRVYLTGLSLGGFGSFDLAARRPETFAAVVPICGGGDPATASKIAAIPFYIVHGDDDPIVPTRLSRAMRDAIAAEQLKVQAKVPAKEPGGTAVEQPKNPMYREYPKVGHDSWTPAYRFGDEGVLNWMFSQRRKGG